MNGVIRWDMKLTDREVLKAIARMQKPKNFDDLADSLGCSTKTVQRAIRRLQATGMIEIMNGGGRVPYRYRVIVEKVPAGVLEIAS